MIAIVSKWGVNVRFMSVLALVAVILLAACGGDASTPTPSSAAPTAASSDAVSSDSASSVTINATLREWAIDLSQTEVAAGNVTFNVTNSGSMEHNLTVLDNAGKNLGATPTFRGSEGTQTLVVDLTPGTYTLICSLPGHAQRGQRIDLVVK